MGMTKVVFGIAFLIAATATGTLLRTALAQTAEDPSAAAIVEGATRMVVLKDQDVSGEVFKRLGLPNQNYCWEQCLQEERCAATRWGVIEGASAGQCQLLSGELTFGGPRDLKTSDGLRILVTASKKENVAAEEAI